MTHIKRPTPDGFITYTLEDVARILHVSTRTVSGYVKAGRLHGQKVGGRWIFSETSLQRFIDGE